MPPRLNGSRIRILSDHKRTNQIFHVSVSNLLQMGASSALTEICNDLGNFADEVNLVSNDYYEEERVF